MANNYPSRPLQSRAIFRLLIALGIICTGAFSRLYASISPSVLSISPGLHISASPTDTSQLQCGDTLCVEIRVDSGFVALMTMQFSINWDTTELSFLDSVVTVIPGSKSFGVLPDSGTATYSWANNTSNFDGITLPDGALLLTLKFIAKSSAGPVNVDITGQPSALEALNALFEPINVFPNNLVMVSAIPVSVTWGPDPFAPFGSSSASLSYSSPTGGAAFYSIDFDSMAAAVGFIDVMNVALPTSPISIAVPFGVPSGFYSGSIWVSSGLTGCNSIPHKFTLEVLTQQVLVLHSTAVDTSGLICGDTLCVEIRVDTGFTRLMTMQYSVNWDTNRLEIIDTTIVDIPGSVFVGINDSLGQAYYSWANNTNMFGGITLADSTLLLTLKFRALNADGTATVEITDIPSTMEALDSFFQYVSVLSENDVAVSQVAVSAAFGADPTVGLGDLFAYITYSNVTGNAGVYSIDFDSTAETFGFVDVVDSALTSSPIAINVPPVVPSGFYSATISVSNGKGGCNSTPHHFSVEVLETDTVELVITGPGDALCDSIVAIDIRAGDGFDSLITLQYGIRWDTANLKFLADSNLMVLSGTAPDLSKVGVDTGLIIYTWLDATAPFGATVNPGDLLFRLYFEVNGRTDTAASVDITDNPIMLEALNYAFSLAPVLPVNSVAIDLTPVAIALGPDPAVCQGDSVAAFTFTGLLNAPDVYSIDFDTAAETVGFTDVVNGVLPTSPISIVVPDNASAGMYQANLTVKNTAEDCTSEIYPVTITINETPVGAGLSTTICSGTMLNLDLQQQIVNNAQNVLFSWSAADNPNVSGETTNATMTDTIGDLLVNTSPNPEWVFYTIMPSGGAGCPGMPFVDSVLVEPEPVLMTPASLVQVCSDEALGYVLGSVPGSATAATFDVLGVNVQAQLIPGAGNASIPAVDVSAPFLAFDTYTNLTGGGRRVDYLVLPYSIEGCPGEPDTVSFRILAEPRMADDTIEVCSNEPLNYILNTVPGSFAANGYELISVISDSALTSGAGNAMAGLCLPDSVLKNDTWNNGTANELLAVYTIRPLRGCPTGAPGKDCGGDTVVLVVKVKGQPLVTCPATVQVTTSSDGTGDCEATFMLTHPLFAGLCQPVGLQLDFSPGIPTPAFLPVVQMVLPGDTDSIPFAAGETVLTYLVTDGFSNTGTCSFSVVVADNEAPSAVCPPNIQIGTDQGICGAIQPNLGILTPSDNCVVDTVLSNASDTFPVGSTQVVYTVYDAYGNTAMCTQTVVVVDSSAPVLMCNDTLVVGTEPAECVANTPALPNPPAMDNCSTVIFTYNAPPQLPLGINLITFTGTDVSGNSATCAQVVKVVDDDAPTIICPNDVSVNANPGFCYALSIPLSPASANDNCPNVTVVNNAPPFYPVGATNLVYTATDAGGNATTCITVVTVIDNQPPTIVCPQNVTVNANGNCFATNVVIGLPQLADNCTIAGFTENAPDSFPLGVTPVLFTVTDASGNTATCTKTVTVLDNTPPVIVCPADLTTSTDSGVCFAMQVDLGAPVITDNCAGPGFSTDVPASYPIGMTSVLYIAFDNNGNSDSCTQKVTVVDSEVPMITCPPDVTLNTDPQLCTSSLLPIDVAVATDNCGIDTVGNTRPAVLPLGQTIIVHAATDVNGNSATCTQQVTVIDQEAPVLTNCPANISVNAQTGSCTAAVSWAAPTATDNCTGLQLNATHQPGAVFPAGQTTVVYTAIDGGGATSACSFVITVSDLEPPVLSGCPANIDISNTPGSCGANVAWTPPTAQDNCSNATISTNHNPGAFFGIGKTVVVYTAMDNSGNSATCSFTIDVRDTEPPVLACPNDLTVNTQSGICQAVVNWQAPVPTDNCPGAVITGASHSPGSVFQPGMVTVNYTTVDAAGNTASCSFTLTVVDAEAPAAVCVPTLDVNLNANGQAAVNPVLLNGGSTDNCGIATYTAQPTDFGCAQVGIQPVVLIITDAAGNSDSCTSQVSVFASAVCAPPSIDNTGGPNVPEPCTCLGNGRFVEEVVVGPAGSGQNWRVVSTTLIDPATGSLYPGGTPLVEIPVGGGQSIYVLNGIHLDSIGYLISVTSSFYPNVVLTFGNRCFYPDATITASDLGPYCQFTPPVTFTGQANGGIGGTGQFFVNNNPVPTVQSPPNSGNWVTTVDVGSLGAGQQVLRFAFDAGDPAGQLPPDSIGCAVETEMILDVSPTPPNLTCNPVTTVQLGPTCMETVTADEVLSTSVGCIDDYVVTIVGPGGQLGNTVGAPQIGQMLMVTVTNLVNGANCSGGLTVVDQLAPVLNCTDIFVPCVVTNTDPQYLTDLGIADAFPAVMDNCSASSNLNFASVGVELGCTDSINGLGNISAYVRRTWTATDQSGNTGSCVQFVYIERLPVAAVQFPGTITVSCEDAVNPAVTGTPFVTVGNEVFPIYPSAGLCEFTTIFSDAMQPGTGCGASTILRTWQVFGTCQPGSVIPPNFNPRVVTQTIEVIDNNGPVIACPNDTIVSVNQSNCCGNVNLPDVIVSDPCSRVKAARALIVSKDPVTGDTLFIFTVAASLTDFPGNDPQDPDTLASYGTTTCLPIGQYTVVYTAEDVCGNIGSCEFQMTVGDQNPPTAACTDLLSVILDANGSASLDATDLDNGSGDNCGTPYFKVRRQLAATCQGYDQFFDEVLFCCDDVGDTAEVILRVYDVQVPVGPVALDFAVNSSADCIARVLARDTVAPICIAPNDTIVTCGTYTPDLGNFANATVNDNCCLDTLLLTVDLAQFDTACKRGSVIRTFTAVDCDGNMSTCEQNIQFDYIQTYVIRFPDDVVVPSCNTGTLYGEPEFFLNNCENLDVTYDDVFVPDSSGNCNRVERTWRIVNFCNFNPAIPLTLVPNPQPELDPQDPANLPGPVVAPNNTPAPWMPTFVSITPATPPVGFNQFWNSQSNGYTYVQYLWILDTVAPVAIACPTDTVLIGNAVNNDDGLWNAAFWFDPLSMSNNLCEADVALAFEAEDNCGGDLLNLRYELFLDLDGNGTQETVVKSDSLPSVNTVQFNNLASGSVNGGTAGAFDQRGVPVNQQYRFALEQTANGNQATGRVRWNTPSAPNAFIDPKLPNGTHRIVWVAEDACGNETSCAYVFTIRDTLAPALLCAGDTFDLLAGGILNLPVLALVDSAGDNCTPAGKLNFSLRIAGTGNGFPLDSLNMPITQLLFDCNSLGALQIEVWVSDLRFNTAVCTTQVVLADPVGFCTSTLYDVAGNIKTDKLQNFKDGEMSVMGSHPSGFTFTAADVTDADGNYFWDNIAPDGSTYTVTPFADNNPLNGVFTSDLVVLQNHLLLKDTLDTPYRIIAADANRSGTVTGIDLTEIRRLILGITSKFTNNTSWRFVDASWVFPNPLNPFNPKFPETITIDSATMDELMLDFVAVKVGDVNVSGQPNNLINISVEDRTAGAVNFKVKAIGGCANPVLEAGEEVLLEIEPEAYLMGYQFTLLHEGLDLVELMPEQGMTLDYFGVFSDQDALTTSWNGEQPGAFKLRLRARHSGPLREMLRVSGSITPAQAYRSLDEQPRSVALLFEGDQTAQPARFELYQNRPNPFAELTWIGFNLPVATEATLRIVDETGKVLHQRTADYPAGEHYLPVSAGELGAPGVLFYELTTPENRAAKKMVRIER